MESVCTLPAKWFKCQWLFLLAIASLCLILPDSVLAQETELNIRWEKTENGTTKSLEKTEPTPSSGDLTPILEEFGIDDEFKNLKAGEEIEIIVRRKRPGGTEESHIEIEKAFPGPSGNGPSASNARPLLGVEFGPVLPENAASLQFPYQGGSLVVRVLEGTAADRYGILENDIITAIESFPVKDWPQLREYIAKFEAGQRVRLTIWRNAQKMTTEVVLGDGHALPVEEKLRFLRSEDMKDVDRILKDLRGPESVNPTDHEAFMGIFIGKETEKGIEVANLMANGTAEGLGVRPNDIIIEVNGEHVDSPAELQAETQLFRAGDPVQLTVLRGGRELCLPAISGIARANLQLLPPSPTKQVLWVPL